MKSISISLHLSTVGASLSPESIWKTMYVCMRSFAGIFSIDNIVLPKFSDGYETKIHNSIQLLLISGNRIVLGIWWSWQICSQSTFRRPFCCLLLYRLKKVNIKHLYLQEIYYCMFQSFARRTTISKWYKHWSVLLNVTKRVFIKNYDIINNNKIFAIKLCHYTVTIYNRVI